MLHIIINVISTEASILLQHVYIKILSTDQEVPRGKLADFRL